MRALFLFLICKAVCVALLIYFAPIGLAPDEAQYWVWSQQLDFGYYSKPPAIAWQIAASTFLFGDTHFGVRMGAVVIGTAIPCTLFWSARKAGISVFIARYAALLFALSPLGILATFFATTDGGMVLFWILASGIVARGLARGVPPNYTLYGLFIAFGALYKWPIYLQHVLVVCFAIPFKELRKGLLWGILLSLCGLFPSLYWNALNDFATFRHVLATGQGRGNFVEFFAAQFALFSPVFFTLLLFAFVSLLRFPSQYYPSVAFLGGGSFLLLVAYCFLAFFKKMQGNWAVFLYPNASIFLAWWALRQKGWKKALDWGMGLSVGLTVLLFVLSLLPHALPKKQNPLKHLLEGLPLTAALEKVGYNPDEHFLCAHTYQMASLLSFYSPGQKRAYFLNLEGRRKNQFDYWPTLFSEQFGKDGFFVVSGEEKRGWAGRLSPFFRKVTHHPLEGIHVFKVFEYNGRVPNPIDVY